MIDSGIDENRAKSALLSGLEIDYNKKVAFLNGLNRSYTNSELGATLQAMKNMINELKI